MRRLLLAGLFMVGVLGAVVIAPSGGRQIFPPGVAAGATPTPSTPITHVIVIMQENRTPDNMFNGFPGANTVTHMKDSTGTDVTLQPSPNGIQNSCDMSHSSAAFQAAANASGGQGTFFQGGNTGFDLEGIADGNCTGLGGATRGAFTYVQQTYVQRYWDIATFDGKLNDNTFGSVMGPSAPEHLYEAGAMARFAPGSNLSVTDNDVPGNTNFGCIHNGTTNYKDATAAYPAPVATVLQSCITGNTIMDELEAKGLGWFMAPTSVHPSGTQAYWVFPANYANKCLPLNGSNTGCNNTSFLQHVATAVPGPAPNLVNIINSCQETQAVWYYIPSNDASDHPNTTSNGGPQAVMNIVNAVGESPCSNGSVNWTNTVVVILWDDWGGFADHVAPFTPAWNPNDDIEVGFRVPLITVSAYNNGTGVVDHTQGDSMGCLNHYLEGQFTLPAPLSAASIDVDCTNDWATHMFNFNQAPATFVPIT